MSAALKTARNIEESYARALALGDIATAQAEAGHVSAALETARSVEESPSLAFTLRSIAAAQAKAGGQAEARQTFAAALKTARRLRRASSVLWS